MKSRRDIRDQSDLRDSRDLKVNRQVQRVAIWLCGVTALAISCGCAAENPIPLQTELKVQSVGAAVRAPLGWQYRPGELIPLDVFVDNPGAAMSAEIALTEGNASGGFAERTAPVVTLPAGKSRHVLSARTSPLAPALGLSIHSHSDGGGSAELFRASLSPLLAPLPAGGRLILVCSSVPAGRFLPHGPNDSSPHCAGKDLPAEAWMWESVDWLVLNDGTIKEAPMPARLALNLWLEGGGRIFLGSAEALAAAHGLGLLPLNAETPLEAEVSWWEKNAGLRKGNVLAEKNFRPVFAWLNKGLGKVVFLFPGANANDADGAAVFNRAELQRPRSGAPDVRVDPERYEMFSPAAASSGRRNAVLLWAGLGAVLLCAALFFSHSSKSRFEAVILPFGVALLLAALIANGFPRAELLATRVSFERHAADGAILKDEWTMLESFRRELECTARGPVNAAVSPVMDESNELRSVNLSRSFQDGRMKLAGILVRPENAALIHASQTILQKNSAAKSVLIQVKFFETMKEFRVAADCAQMKLGAWVDADGELRIIALDANGQPPFIAAPLNESEMAQRFSLAAAEVNALRQAFRSAREVKSDALIFWRESGRQKHDDSAQLVEIEPPASYESEFVVRIFFQRSH